MKKKAQSGFPDSPSYVAEQLKDVIHVMIGRMSTEAQVRSYPNLRGKISELNVSDISSKKTPGGASIGMSISLIKNVLNGRDPYFVKVVLEELSKRL